METLLFAIENAPDQSTYFNIRKHLFGALDACDLLCLSLASRATLSLSALRDSVVTSRLRSFAEEKFLERNFLDLFGGTISFLMHFVVS
jgi:hypothetical protein